MNNIADWAVDKLREVLKQDSSIPSQAFIDNLRRFVWQLEMIIERLDTTSSYMESAIIAKVLREAFLKLTARTTFDEFRDTEYLTKLPFQAEMLLEEEGDRLAENFGDALINAFDFKKTLEKVVKQVEENYTLEESKQNSLLKNTLNLLNEVELETSNDGLPLVRIQFLKVPEHFSTVQHENIADFILRFEGEKDSGKPIYIYENNYLPEIISLITRATTGVFGLKPKLVS